MKLNARVLMHLALGTSSLAMLGCEPAAPAPVQRPEPLVVRASAPVEPARVQPTTAPESLAGAAVRFAAPPLEPERAVEPEPAPQAEPETAPKAEPEPATPVVKRRPRQISRDYCPPCGRG